MALVSEVALYRHEDVTCRFPSENGLDYAVASARM